MRIHKFILVFTLLAGLSALWLNAQPAAVQQFESVQRKSEDFPLFSSLATNRYATAIFPGETEDVGPQEILKIKPRRTWIEASADTQYFYTDNVFLSGDPKISTCVAVNTVQVAIAPTPFEVGHGKLAPSVGFRSQWFNYGLDGTANNLDFLNFDAQTVFLTGRYAFGKDWQVFGGVDYTRLLDQVKYQEFYHEFVPSLGVQRLFSLRENLLLSASVQADYHFSTVDPFPRSDINDRFDATFTLALCYQPASRLLIQPYCRFQYTQYPRTAFDIQRNDYLGTVGLSVAYFFNKNLSARVFVSEDIRQSDDRFTPNYQNFDAGIGASVVYRF